MRGWGLVFGLLAGVALVAVVLEALPPFVVVILAAAGIAVGLRRYRADRRVEKGRTEATALGLERSPDDRFGLRGLPLQLMSRGGGEASVENVMWGTWRALDVKLFDFRYRSAEDAPGEGRRFVCALIPIEADCPPVVMEPKTFFTPAADLGTLDPLDPAPEGFEGAYDVRTTDRAFADALLQEDLRRWIIETEGDVAFEVSGRMLLCYAPHRRRDTFALLEVATGFGRRIPAEVRTRHPG